MENEEEKVYEPEIETKLNNENMEDMFTNYMEAINTHDFSQVSKLLHENAIFYFAGEANKNIEQIKTYHDNFWNAIKDSKFWATDIKIIHRDNKCHIYTYQYNYSGYNEGKYIEGNGRTTDVFIKHDETKQWQLLHEHSSCKPK